MWTVIVVLWALFFLVMAWVLVGGWLDRRRAPEVAEALGWDFAAEGALPRAVREFDALPSGAEPRVLWLMGPPGTDDAVFRHDSRSERRGAGYFGYGKPWVRVACAYVAHDRDAVSCSIVRYRTPAPRRPDPDAEDLARFELSGPDAADPTAVFGPTFTRLLQSRPERGDRFEVHIRPGHLLVLANAVRPQDQPKLLELAQDLGAALDGGP